MRIHEYIVFLVVMMALLLAACGPDAEAAIATGIVQTQLFGALETAAAGAAQEQTATESGQASTTPTETEQATFTPAPPAAFVTVSQNTNCRSGPRVDYSFVTTINAGQQVEVLKTFSKEYAVVRNPNGEGDCWLFLQYADTTEISAFNLAAATQPPTPRASVNISARANVGKSLPGACPILVQFDGAITVSGAVTLSYYWERSDGSHSAAQSLTFSQASSKFVHDRVEIGKPGKMIDVWERLHITAPEDVTSNRASFQYNCP